MKTQTRTMLALAAVLLLVGVAGCLGGGAESPEQQEGDGEVVAGGDGEVVAGDDNYRDGTLRRYVDREAGVVCYEKSMPSGTSVDCLPLNETNL